MDGKVTDTEPLAALEAAYRFITQPRVMKTPRHGMASATYDLPAGFYNALTGKLHAAIVALRPTGSQA
jgi:hypothetical protein